ncbi:helix-turn-helix domain-containing protein [Bradyrhizobium sp. 153]|uniref:helix-turn-helix domain-containing protein n=1 Tax=Bradyrhizobium sp. 153 TaxID=2782627 RepID=UPI001FFAFCC4|nr:helix-turn-helix domain-containing protein [Bradyrhizobium sp. 153]MCK1668676.1 helix-turn-helix domain-containing protein [Bradyrhizobium sp. 153]
MLDHNVDLSGVPFEERSFGVKAACKLLDIKESFYFELIAAGEIDTYKSGRSRKITGRAINAYRSKCEEAA